MARLHSFYISNAQQELNYVGKDLPDDAFDQIMKEYVKSITLDSDMFEINEEEEDEDKDPFENLVPENEDDKEEEEEEGAEGDSNVQSTGNNSSLLIGDLIKLNNSDEEETNIPEEIDHGDLNFNIDDIIANASNLNSSN